MQSLSPALLQNVIKLAAENGKISLISRKAMLLQWRHGLTIQFGPIADPLGILIFWPLEDGTMELATIFGDGAPPKMLQLIRVGQLTVREMAQDTGNEIFSYVHAGDSAGMRMAKLMGFVFDKRIYGEKIRVIFDG